MFCWENLGPGIHVDGTLTHITYQKIAEDHIHPFLAMEFPDGSVLFQQDNVPCYSAIVQEWFE